MRKLSFLIVLLFITNTFHAQHQSGEIIYKVKLTSDYQHWKDSILDSNENELAALFVKKTLDRGEKAMSFLQFSLNFNSTSSLFEKPNNMNSDSGIDLDMEAGSVGMTGLYYTNSDEEILLHQFKGVEKDWIIKTSLDSLDWKISNETKEIQGYLCRKATTVIDLNNRVKGEITAWFAPDLPFQFGPLEFAGLPGMILGVERNHRYFYADQIKLSKKNKTIKKPTKGKVASKEEYYQAIKDWEKKR